MKIKFNITKLGLYIYLEGELDECYGSLAKRKLDELIESNANVSSVVFNMKGVTFMDSTGIGVLLGRYKKLKNMRIATYIENPSFSVDKVFSISGIYNLIPKI